MPHLSHSQITAYLGCARRWAFSRQEREPSGYQGVLGTVVHSVLEHAMRTMAEGRPLPDLDELKEMFIVNWQSQSGDKSIKWYGVAPVAASIRGEAMLTAVYPYLEHIQPLSVEAVEQSFSIPLDVPGWTLDGRADVFTETDTIIDFKTASQPWSEVTAAKSLQPQVYYLAFARLYGREPSGFTFLTMVLDPKAPLSSEAEVQVIRTYRTQEQVRLYRGLANQIARAIDAGVYPPNPTFEWHHKCYWKDRCAGELLGEVK